MHSEEVHFSIIAGFPHLQQVICHEDTLTMGHAETFLILILITLCPNLKKKKREKLYQHLLVKQKVSLPRRLLFLLPHVFRVSNFFWFYVCVLDPLFLLALLQSLSFVATWIFTRSDLCYLSLSALCGVHAASPLLLTSQSLPTSSELLV